MDESKQTICQAKEIVFKVIGTMVHDTFPNPPEDITEEVLSELLDNNLLAPAPQIIRTIEEMEALDPDTVVILTQGAIAAENAGYDEEAALPAVVIATGAQVRAARTALQEV